MKTRIGIGLGILALVVACEMQPSSKKETAPTPTPAEEANNRIEGCALLGMTVMKAVPVEFDVAKTEPEAKRACTDTPLKMTDLSSCMTTSGLLYNAAGSKGTYAPLPRDVLRTISVACGMIIYGADRATAEEIADKAMKENRR